MFIEDDDSSNTIYTEVNGDFFFVLTAFNPDGPVRQVKLGSNAAILEEGATYDLGVGASGGYFGEVLFFNNETPVTTAMMGGTMTITKLNQENNIVSGTFSFDVVNPQGELVEIRQGRFDQLFEN